MIVNVLSGEKEQAYTPESEPNELKTTWVLKWAITLDPFSHILDNGFRQFGGSKEYCVKL